jgi:RraA family protein
MSVGFRVYTRVNRPDPALVQRFAKWLSPDLSDVISRAGTMENAIHPMYLPVKRAVGPAVTVSVPTGTFSVIKAGMQQTRAGDVLVVNGRGSLNGALFGSNVCRGLLHRGVAGLIVDGAIRDVSEIQTDGLPVFARGVSAGMGSIDGPGEVNVPIACGGVVVNPGDIVVADQDGIVVIRPVEAEYVLNEVAKLKAKHDAVQPILLRGEVTNIVNIEKNLREQGCEFI